MEEQRQQEAQLWRSSCYPQADVLQLLVSPASQALISQVSKARLRIVWKMKGSG